MESLPASEAFENVHCPLHDLAVMEHCFQRRRDFIAANVLKRGSSSRGDKLSLDMCVQIVADVRHVRIKAGEEKPDKTSVRQYALVANNDMMDNVFELCAERDMDSFPIKPSGMKDEGTRVVQHIPFHVQLCMPFWRSGMMRTTVTMTQPLTSSGSPDSSRMCSRPSVKIRRHLCLWLNRIFWHARG